ncbi:MAG TPA: gluconolaconase, partial [Novosphingobium sp.]|nr:gluconolaconase [Novosphingobium sp.]
MPSPETRFAASAAMTASPGWHLSRVVRPSRLNGANGLRTGADGRIYVAQVAGSCVSAINPDTGDIEAFSAMGAGITAPDDLAFDEAGNLYCTEITENRISVRRPDGRVEVLLGDVPVANPITYHQGRLIAGECRVGARILEVDRGGGAPRVILADVPMVNAFEVGPDGKLYFPVMGTNEIWRIGLDGGEAEVVAGDLGVPDSLKFDSQGRIVTTQVASGQVLRIDPRTGAREVLADIGPGLDNVTFVGDRIFVSHITGSVHEILEPGKVRALVDKGLQWPLGLALSADGALYVADGGFSYVLFPDGRFELLGMLFTPGTPGFTRGVAAGGPGEWTVTTANGDVARWRPAEQAHDVLASGRDRLMGVCTSGAAGGFAEFGTGKLLAVEGGAVSELASGLDQPMGVAAADGAVFVAEAGAGRVT